MNGDRCIWGLVFNPLAAWACHGSPGPLSVGVLIWCAMCMLRFSCMLRWKEVGKHWEKSSSLGSLCRLGILDQLVWWEYSKEIKMQNCKVMVKARNYTPNTTVLKAFSPSWTSSGTKGMIRSRPAFWNIGIFHPWSIWQREGEKMSDIRHIRRNKTYL